LRAGGRRDASESPYKMLSKAYRLSKEKDITAVLRKGKGFDTEYFTLRVLKKELKKPRFGFIFSKKIHNKPTKRNLPKKRMRHIMAGLKERLLFNGDFLFIGKKKILELEYTELKDEMLKTLKKTRAIS